MRTQARISDLMWRVLNDPPLPGYRNMARDHALTETLRGGEGLLRFYRWDPPTISFGRNEPSRGLFLEQKAKEEGFEFVRRPTGGRAVLHDRELTYSLAFPLDAFGGLKVGYRLINRGLMLGIQRLGAAVELARPDGPGLPPDAGPCFRQPAEGEVTALGRKLVGSAQVRMGDSVLQHGSIILDGDQDGLRRLRGGTKEVPPPATLAGLLGRLPETDVLADALQEGLASVLGGRWVSDSYRTEEKMRAEALEGHYLDAEWTWRV